MTDLLIITTPSTFGLWLFVALACTITAFDLRQMRIPDGISLALLGLFVAQWLVVGVPADWIFRLCFCAFVFAAGFCAFALRAMGGGDVKVLTVLALFVPAPEAAQIALLFSAMMLLSIGCVLITRRLVPPIEGWAFLQTNRLPMGVAIGAAAALAPFMPFA